jgi:beta-lactamase regulating signal transducer with metallopeptidase domain
MTVVTHAMLGNAAAAAVLAVLALVVGRACRSPAVRHVAWVLLLLKLVTPPLFHVPLPVLPASWSEAPAEPALAAGRVVGPLPPTADAHGPAAGGVATGPAWWDRSWAETAARGAVAVWVAGAVGWFVWQGRRIVRFRRRVARAEDASPEVVAATRRLAAALGIAAPPVVRAATGIGSPMLWGWGRGAVILFPRDLLARLAPESRDTLLAHELAHFLRRDHWVRLLELVATGLYWWHPAAWLARAGIESAEEECCDAWVVGGLAASPRRYAEALLATVDFAAELRRPCLPPGACAANRGARLLRRRLIAILHARRPAKLGRAVRTAAAAVLLTQPVLIVATPKPAESPEIKYKGWSIQEETTVPPSSALLRPPEEPTAWATAPAPGGALTAVARDNEVVLRRPDGTEKALGPGKPVALAFAPDGQRLATAGPGALVRTWDDRGCLLAKTRVPAAAWAVAYTPDGNCVLVLDAARGISVRDARTLAPLSSWTGDGPANSIACSPDGQCVAVSFGSWLDADVGWVECWSIRERKKLAVYEASAPVGATRFTPDGRLLVIGGWNGLLAWRAFPDGELLAERKLPKDVVAAAAFSPDAGALPLVPPPEPPAVPVVPPGSLPRRAPDLLRGFSQLPQD